MSNSRRLAVLGLSASWGAAPVLDHISFDVETGEFLVLMGPNGGGKTTLLRCLAGLEPVTSGTVELDGRSLEGVPTFRRGIGMLFQDPAIFPGRTVWENIAYGPMIAHLPDREVDERVSELLTLLHLRGFEDRRAEETSGGERQRIALARTLAARPKLVLLDEPFASVDTEIKDQLRSEFRSVLRAMGVTAIHVTHDREEALFLGDRVAVLMAGRLEQIGDPEAVLNEPVNERVASFLGYNLIGDLDGRTAVHPDDVTLVVPGRGATVVAAGPIGRAHVAHVLTDAGERVVARYPGGGRRLRAGDSVGLAFGRSIRYPPPLPPRKTNLDDPQ